MGEARRQRVVPEDAYGENWGNKEGGGGHRAGEGEAMVSGGRKVNSERVAW